MKDKIFDSPSLIPFLDSFFQSHSVAQHLRFFEDWFQLVMTDNFCTAQINPSEALSFHDQLQELYKLLFQMVENEDEIEKLKASTAPIYPHSNYNYTLHYLSKEEIIDPILAIAAIFETNDLDYYKAVLHTWLKKSLNSNLHDGISIEVFPLYATTKKLIEACWLLHHSVVNERKQAQGIKKLICFEQTCPFLLQDSNLLDPYLEVESFFSGASLGRYRKDLKNWFQCALTENAAFKNSSALIYYHRQLIQLIHAGYLIVQNNLVYKRDKPYSSNALTFGDWIKGVKEKSVREGRGTVSDYEVHKLNADEKLNPIQYLIKTLKLNKIKQIRYGLQEWLFCASNKKNSLIGTDDRYILKLFLTLEKLLEAFFLLVAGDKQEVTFSTHNHD